MADLGFGEGRRSDNTTRPTAEIEGRGGQGRRGEGETRGEWVGPEDVGTGVNEGTGEWVTGKTRRRWSVTPVDTTGTTDTLLR